MPQEQRLPQGWLTDSFFGTVDTVAEAVSAAGGSAGAEGKGAESNSCSTRGTVAISYQIVDARTDTACACLDADCCQYGTLAAVIKAVRQLAQTPLEGTCLTSTYQVLRQSSVGTRPRSTLTRRQHDQPHPTLSGSNKKGGSVKQWREKAYIWTVYNNNSQQAQSKEQQHAFLHCTPCNLLWHWNHREPSAKEIPGSLSNRMLCMFIQPRTCLSLDRVCCRKNAQG